MAYQKLVLPEQLRFLLNQKARYKVAWGGRSSTKSTSYIKALIARSCSENVRILCTREIQSSIRESVYKLISDQCNILGVSGKFSFKQSEILNLETGSHFIFEGMYSNQDRIKSLEGVDVCYVEEANKLSDESWEILIPTIRKEGSEFWIVFNGESEEDPAYKRFVINQPPNCITVKINYTDVPQEWLSEEIIAEANYCKANDPTAYNRIWLGIPAGGGGRIWTPYNEEVHIKDFAWEEVRIRANCYMAMDPHSKYFPFCAWIAAFPIDNTGKEFKYYIYNEWPTFDMFGKYYSEIRKDKLFSEWGSLKDLAREIQIYDGQEYGLKVAKRFIDTRYAKAGGGDNWTTSTSGIIQEMSRPINGGLHFNMPPERIIDIQRERILDKLRYNTLLPMNEFNQPGIYVAPWCRNIRQSLKFHRLEEKSERENDKYKDASDTLRICFAGMSGTSFFDERSSMVQQQNTRTFEVSYTGQNSAGLGWMA